jgi:hypothetical protein
LLIRQILIAVDNLLKVIVVPHQLSWCLAAFDEVPVSQEVATGAEAVFRCRYPTADIIRWRVNGSLVGRSPPRYIIPSTIIHDDNGNLVDTLTIIARPELNGTEVVCVARFDDDRPEEPSQPVTLIGTDGVSCFLIVTDDSSIDAATQHVEMLC